MVVAALITKDPSSPVVRVLHLVRSGSVRALISTDLLAECREVLLRPRLMRRHGRTESEIDELLRDLQKHGVHVEPPDAPVEGPDPNDAHLWRLLSTDRSAILITGDLALQRGPPSWARVMTPREWIDSLFHANS